MDAYDAYMKWYGQIGERLQTIGKLVAGHKDQVDFEMECDWSHANDLAKVKADLDKIVEFLSE